MELLRLEEIGKKLAEAYFLRLASQTQLKVSDLGPTSPVPSQNLISGILKSSDIRQVQITDKGRSLYIQSDLNFKINSPDQATNKILKTNNYNNQ